MIAHVRTSDGLPQPLDMHCRNVRLLCARAAKPLGLEAAVYSIRALPMHAFERRRPHQLHPFRDFGQLPGSCSDHPRHRHAFHPYRWQQNLRQPALYAAPRRCAWSAPHFSTLSPTTRSSTRTPQTFAPRWTIIHRSWSTMPTSSCQQRTSSRLTAA